MMHLCYILFAIYGLGLCKAQSSFQISSSKNESFNVEKLDAKIVSVINSIKKQMLPVAYGVTTKANISLSCTLSLFRFFTDISKLKIWAWKMLDASAKLPSGILEGIFAMLGDYDECLGINVRNSRGKPLFEGKYCLIKLRLLGDALHQLRQLNRSRFFSQMLRNAPLKILSSKEAFIPIGLCLPSTCTAQELNQVLRVATRNTEVLKLSSEVKCETKSKKTPNPAQILILCILSVFGFMVIIGTCLDVIQKHTLFKIKSGELNKLLIGFSFYTNTIRLFGTVQHETKLSALRGCRVLTAFWIILGHVYFYPNEAHFVRYSGLLGFKEWLETTIMFQTIIGATLAIDTFFVLSGMLFLYLRGSKLETSKEWIKLPLYIVLRAARILPIEMLFIGIFMLLPLISNGPLSEHTYKRDYNNCKNYWWRNVLFIQNFWPLDQTCVSQTWFIATLLQVFLLTFWNIWLLCRWPKIGIATNIMVILIGCLLTGFLTSYYNVLPYFSPIEQTNEMRKFSVIIYTGPHTYLPSFCIGILLGYAVVKKQNPKIKLWIQMILWLAAISGALAALYSKFYLLQNDNDTNRRIDILYAALHRTVWSLSISWMLFACATGYGGIIGKFLSWKALIPLDRLTLMIYLIHPLVQAYQTAVTRSLTNLGHIEQIHMYFATITASVMISYLLNVTFEQPLKHIESYLSCMFSRNPSPDTKQPEIAMPSTNALVFATKISR